MGAQRTALVQQANKLKVKFDPHAPMIDIAAAIAAKKKPTKKATKK